MKKIRIYCLAILVLAYINPILVSAEVADDYEETVTLEEYIEKPVDNSLRNPDAVESKNEDTVDRMDQELDDTNSLEKNSDLSADLKDDRSLKAIVASGIFGTSKWQIDNTGTLHIFGGEFIDNRNQSPWSPYRNQIKKIVFDGPVKASSNSSSLFSNLDQVVEFENLNELDTSNVTIMRDMFSNTNRLISLDLSNFDTSKVTDMAFMFSYAGSLENLNISNFNTSNVVYMRSMFYGTTNLNDLDISNFDTSHVKDMSGLFMNSGVNNLEVSYFFTNSATDMSGMFSGVDLDTLDLSNFDTSKVTTMSSMFSWSKINHLNVSNFDTSQLRNMGEMFTGSQISKVDLSSFDTINVTNMNNMFSSSQLNSIDISNFDTSQVIYMYDMFAGMNDLRHINLGENFQFKDGAVLPSPSISLPYYGKWQREHEGAVYTSDELAEQYNGFTMSGNYYWAEKKPTLEVKDSVIYEGEKWDPRDNFISAADEDGNLISFDPSMTSDSVNTEVPGLYEVTYTNGIVSKTITVTVKENLETIEAKNSIIYTNETWNAKDNFVSSTNKEGHNIEFVDSMTTDKVDTTTPGIYQVTYINGSSSMTIEVVVKENKESIHAKDSIIYVGDSWEGIDNFISATDKDGNGLVFTNTMFTGVVDTETPGDYSVVYTNGKSKQIVTISVKENKESIQAHNSTIEVGDVWNAQDNFQGATDKAGLQVSFKDVLVTGSVDTSKVGKYEIVYTYDKVSVKINVYVEEKIDTKYEENDNHNENILNITKTSTNNNTVSKAHKVFPKTGERVNVLLVVFGGVLSILSMVILKLRRESL